MYCLRCVSTSCNEGMYCLRFVRYLLLRGFVPLAMRPVPLEARICATRTLTGLGVWYLHTCAMFGTPCCKLMYCLRCVRYPLPRGYVLFAMCTVLPAAKLCTARTFTPVHGYGLRGHVLLAMSTVLPASGVCNASDVYGTSCCEVR